MVKKHVGSGIEWTPFVHSWSTWVFMMCHDISRIVVTCHQPIQRGKPSKEFKCLRVQKMVLHFACHMDHKALSRQYLGDFLSLINGNLLQYSNAISLLNWIRKTSLTVIMINGLDQRAATYVTETHFSCLNLSNCTVHVFHIHVQVRGRPLTIWGRRKLRKKFQRPSPRKK